MKYFATRLSENMHVTREGFLLCVGVPIARTGWQEYAEGEIPLKAKDGRIKIFRPENEVFSPATISSFEGKDLTVQHPEEFVDLDNWRDLTNGHLQNVRRGRGEQDQDLLADLLIKDQNTISLVKNGMREVSCGYEADFVQTADGEGEQRRIRGNHLALVDQGRAGPTYAIQDHKGEAIMNKKFLESIKALISTAEKEAPAATNDSAPPAPAAQAPAGDAAEMQKMLDGFLQKLGDMMKPPAAPTDAAPAAPAAAAPAAPAAADEDPMTALVARLDKLEALVTKLAEGGAGTGDEDLDEDDETTDADEDDEDEEVVGDSGELVSRAEILAPGIDTKDKATLKKRALEACYKTADGKKVIDSITGGKPKFETNAEMLFTATSEILKTNRTDAVATAKRKGAVKDGHLENTTSKAMTAEELNAKHAAHWNK